MNLNEQDPRLGYRNQKRENYTGYQHIQTTDAPAQYPNPRGHKQQRGYLPQRHTSHEVST